MAGTPFFQSDTGQTAPPYRSVTELTMDSDRKLRKDGQTLFCNGAQIVTGSGFAPAADGTTRLAQSLSAKAFYIPITGLKAGDELVGFKLLGQIESAGNGVTVNADFRKVTAAAADVTDASVGAITQVSKTADYKIADSKTFSAVATVAADSQYYVLVTATTGASTDVAITGVEVTINRL